MMSCQYDNISLGNYVDVAWNSPEDPKDIIKKYKLQLIGFAQYLDSRGKPTVDEDSPIEVETHENAVKVAVTANTNYSVKICAVTRVGCGNFSEMTSDSSCFTSPSVPTEMPKFELKRAEDTDDCRKFKLDMTRIPERNGPIKCYRIILYKMKNNKEEIPSPRNVEILTYSEVHKEGAYGAYVAEAFSGKKFLSQVTLGDEIQSRCESNMLTRRRRSLDLDDVDFLDDIDVYDGELSADTFYSGFVEVKVKGKDDVILTKRSNLFVPLRTGYLKYNLHATALGVICGLLIVIIILIVALCTLSKRSPGADYDADGGREGGMSRLLCGLFSRPRSGGLRTPVLPTPNVKPLKPENLPSAFLERHKDSDLLFQREFESLPEHFRDRTSRSSDMLENFFKNRYPDIKAYDQTRVKLMPIDGAVGSDYINANFVMGYKDRKKFICAQGPLEKTVNDFWRMIWEHKIQIIAMVTGLEENGKMKCAKYWPDNDEEKKFGNIAVIVEDVNTFADYVVRKFHVSFNKGEETPETRLVTQFHYLTWKDFLAPEHPGGILKFIKRINETYSTDVGPILVHCSAGVGRTGTLVVIDSLLQQLREEGQVEIYNSVVAIRRQRNFLVQSLKQYIFLYRALLEFSQFGDTEIEVKNFKNVFEAMQSNTDKSGKSELQVEFEKLNQIIEDPRTTDVATTDVNANKNKSCSIVPYDRNRVILTPVPSREHSTYINASFIQGYDRTDTFIITQDPLQCTINEFWRMIEEQSASIIIMLDRQIEIQYWPVESADYDHLNVKLNRSQDYDHFYSQEFCVTNTKTSTSQTIVQFQLKGFERSDETVPASSEPCISLVQHIWHNRLDASGTAVVHCTNGADRSSIFVACSILLSQIQNEQRVDVFQTARHLRSQRPSMLQTFSQYEFCYRTALEFVNKFRNAQQD